MIFRQSILAAALLAFAADCCASGIEVLSVRHSQPATSVTADGSSFQPVFSRDGKLVVFSTTAQNLQAGSKRLNRSDLAVCDLSSGALSIVSGPPAGGPGLPGASVAVGIDGDTLFFLSDAPDLIPDISIPNRQLYAQSLSTGARRLLSKNPQTGAPLIVPVDAAIMAKEGRYVFFESAGGDFLSAEFSRTPEIFRVDTSGSDQIALVSFDATGIAPSSFPCRFVSPSASGLLAAYISRSSTPPSSAVLQNLTSKKPIPAFIAGTSVGNSSIEIQLSDDGNFAVARIPAGGSGSFTNGVYWFNLQAKTNAFCSKGLPGTFSIDYTTFAPISFFPGGRTVVFEGLGTNIASKHLWFWNADAALATGFDGMLATDPPSSTEPANSFQPALNPDGTKIAFLSSATNVVPEAADGSVHLYIRTLATGETKWVDRNSHGEPAGLEPSTEFQFSPSGTSLVFATRSPALIDGDLNEASDVFVYDLEADRVRLISAAQPAHVVAAADAGSSLRGNCISADGRFIVFSSLSSDLVANDTNGVMDVFLADRQLHSVSLVSVNTNGTSSPHASSYSPQITSDGRFVLFFSGATNLASGASGSRANLYLRDLAAGTTILASPATPIDPATAPISRATISDDGRFIAYEAGSSQTHAVLRDVVQGTSVPILGAAKYITAGSSQIAANGSLVAYSTGSPDLAVAGVQWIASGSNTQFTATGGNLQLSRNGTILAAFARLSSLGQFSVLDTGSGALKQFTPPGFILSASDWQLAPDGSSIVCAANQTDPPTLELYRLDIAGGTWSIMTTNSFGTPANGTSKAPSFSYDGRRIIFQSNATDLTANGGFGTQNIFARDLETGETSLVSRTPTDGQSSGRSWAPFLSGDSSTAVFISSAPDLASGAQNGFPNLFAASVPAELPTASGVRLQTPATLAGNVTIGWSSAVGVRYQLQYRNHLQDTSWQNLGPAISGNGGILLLPQPLTNGFEAYFTVRLVP